MWLELRQPQWGIRILCVLPLSCEFLTHLPPTFLFLLLGTEQGEGDRERIFCMQLILFRE
jgi:hypothetical protein